MKKLLLTLLVLCTSLIGQDFKGGQFYNSIKCEANKNWSYALYLPKDYEHAANRKWATMINFGAGKGSAKSLKRMVEAAEIANCILVCSIETSNKTKNNSEGMNATIDDVLKRFKVHEKLFFVTGMSGGGRRAFYANSLKKNPVFTGVLPCGAGGKRSSKERKVWFYGACGTNCFNREEMTVSFKAIGKQGKLVYFSGGHAWAGEEQYTEGISWLYAKNLNSISPSDYDKYYKAFCERLKAKADVESDIYRKYRLYSTLALVSRNKAASAVKKELSTLTRSKEIQNYIKAEKDYAKFLLKYYTKNYSDTTKKPLSSKAQKDATKFLAKYAGTPYATLIELHVKAAK